MFQFKSKKGKLKCLKVPSAEKWWLLRMQSLRQNLKKFSWKSLSSFLNFILHNFLWLDSVPGVKWIKRSNFFMLVPLTIWVLVFKRKAGVAKAAFFWNTSVNSRLKIWNHFLDLHQNLHDCIWPQEETFQSFESSKRYDVIWWRHKKPWFFAEKFQNSMLWPTLQVISWKGSVGSLANLVLRYLTRVVM